MFIHLRARVGSGLSSAFVDAVVGETGSNEEGWEGDLLLTLIGGSTEECFPISSVEVFTAPPEKD